MSKSIMQIPEKANDLNIFKIYIYMSKISYLDSDSYVSTICAGLHAKYQRVGKLQQF